MQVSVPKIRWDIDFGQIMLLVGQFVAMAGGIWYVSSIVTGNEYRLQAVEKLSVQYVPVIQGLQKSDDRQEQGMENLRDAFRQQREFTVQEFRTMRIDLGDMSKTLSNVKESQAEIKALLRPKP